jgi:hypothetical protein
MIRDPRSTLKAELPNISEKSETLGGVPLDSYTQPVTRLAPDA